MLKSIMEGVIEPILLYTISFQDHHRCISFTPCYCSGYHRISPVYLLLEFSPEAWDMFL